MLLNLRTEWLSALAKKGGTVIEDYRYRSIGDFGQVDMARFNDNDLKLLDEVLLEAKGVEGARAAQLKIAQYLKVKADPHNTKISRLDTLAEALRNYIGKSPNKWLFEEAEDGHLIVWYVHKIRYEPPVKCQERPACTTLNVSAVKGRFQVDQSFSWYSDQLGKTCPKLLSEKGLLLENPELVQNYTTECQKYKDICNLTGEQFLAKGEARNQEGYNGTLVSMVVDGFPTRVVMDDAVDDPDHACADKRGGSCAASMRLWNIKQKGRFDDDDTDEEHFVALPLQPYVNVFDLIKHCFLTIHSSNLAPYAYDAALIEKLVLEKDKKALISILVAGAGVQMDDIVKGKTGGIIVVCTGPPGVGKTLSAEVFSEEMKRPLYCVQCSQLGTDEKVLEKHLKKVLDRATRWKAILLIDEADVYVHERGNDIKQNAIVGVFLRVLEYYRGILFMTSNRETLIDDAILSRATAWIQYTYPDRDRLIGIWTVLAAQYKVKLSFEQVRELAAHPKLGSNISGRTIKNLLKLSRLLTLKTGQEIDVKVLEYVSSFLDLDGKNRDTDKPDDQKVCACDLL